MAIVSLGADTATSSGTVVTSSASTNTLGTYVSLSAGLANNIYAMRITAWSSSADGARITLTFRKGGTTVILSDYWVSADAGASSRAAQSVWIPISIAAGQSLEVAARSSGGSKSAIVSVQVNEDAQAPASGGTSYTTYGFNTGTTTGTTLNTPPANNTKATGAGAYVQLTASSSAAHTVLFIGINGTATTATEQLGLIDIGTGADGSETVIIPNTSIEMATGLDVFEPCMQGPYWVSVATATRIAALCQLSNTTLPIPRITLYASDFAYPTGGGSQVGFPSASRIGGAIQG